MKYWLMTLFEGEDRGKRLCVDAETAVEAADRLVAAGKGKSHPVGMLPYPANPRLPPPPDMNPVTPAFCFTPNDCVGRSCCPRIHACTE